MTAQQTNEPDTGRGSTEKPVSAAEEERARTSFSHGTMRAGISIEDKAREIARRVLEDYQPAPGGPALCIGRGISGGG